MAEYLARESGLLFGEYFRELTEVGVQRFAELIRRQYRLIKRQLDAIFRLLFDLRYLVFEPIIRHLKAVVRLLRTNVDFAKRPLYSVRRIVRAFTQFFEVLDGASHHFGERDSANER